jgi:hypothetical protein
MGHAHSSLVGVALQITLENAQKFVLEFRVCPDCGGLTMGGGQYSPDFSSFISDVSQANGNPLKNPKNRAKAIEEYKKWCRVSGRSHWVNESVPEVVVY